MLQLRGQPLALKEIAEIASGKVRLELAPAAMAQMEASRRVVRRVAGEHVPVYGINTGFGKLCEVRIADDAIERLQLNLVRSHAAWVGEPLPRDQTRALMAARINCLLKAHSGIRPEPVRLLADCLNRDVLPVIPSQGSVGGGSRSSVLLIRVPVPPTGYPVSGSRGPAAFMG